MSPPPFSKSNDCSLTSGVIHSDDAHAASVHVADEAREVAVPRRVRDERVVLRLPRAIEHDGADGNVAAPEAVDERVGVGAVGDVLR